MKFEKINENKLKITYTKTDLKAQNIDYDKLLNDTEEAQNIILSLVENAQEKFGFDINSYQMVIEAKSMPDNSFEVTITTLDELTKEEQKTPKKKLKLNSLDETEIKENYSNHIIVKFEAFESCLSFVKAIHKKAGLNTNLYKDESNYYLDLKLDAKNDSINMVNLLKLSGDFGIYVSDPELFEGYLKEHANLIIENNAIEKLFDAFQ